MNSLAFRISRLVGGNSLEEVIDALTLNLVGAIAHYPQERRPAEVDATIQQFREYARRLENAGLQRATH